MSNSPSVSSVAGTIVTVDEAVMKALPFVADLVGFIPGAQIAPAIEPLVADLLLAVDNAAKAVQAGNPGQAATDVLQAIIQHLTPGLPNAPVLSTPTAGSTVAG